MSDEHLEITGPPWGKSSSSRRSVEAVVDGRGRAPFLDTNGMRVAPAVLKVTSVTGVPGPRDLRRRPEGETPVLDSDPVVYKRPPRCVLVQIISASTLFAVYLLVAVPEELTVSTGGNGSPKAPTFIDDIHCGKLASQTRTAPEKWPRQLFQYKGNSMPMLNPIPLL